ncbi:peptidase T [Aureibacter tunicatorum]|uniref:Peptidase T n=2 Tax=Aureibacter tunicatorum TaxID=866807 RepID=A0AAE3XUK4_9BACT|nr:peptidase T [Aureibacter tunicatorum]MDR6241999.1 tripeptide aminopeptidase [Aureibacter tunicatorum]BDD07268.1 peptidase T [Aureibacter tunicatorum]
MDVLERFLRYVSYHTTSEFGVKQIPSTERQWVLARDLEKELREIGMHDVSIDDHGYVMGTLPSNVDHEVPTIGFVAHYDTSPDFSGENVKPQIWENYDGKEIILNAAENIVLSPDEFPDLLFYKGQTLITTDGTTLLGADDKAGVTEIVSAMEYLIAHPEIKHGTIKVGFTPDEEVGRGADLFDVKKFGAEWAYTMDGSKVGELEYESFNAAYAKLTFHGKMVHPGYAKGKMKNTMTIAGKFTTALPENEVPEKTSGRDGFYHLTSMEGEVEKTVLQYIIRDFDKGIFENRKEHFKAVVDQFNETYGAGTVELEMFDQYYNMGDVVKDVFHTIDIAKEAMEELNIEPIIKGIRGGTDGARLSFMGLPCPNIFAGGHNFHGRYEFVAKEAIEKATMVICKVAELTAEKYKK